MLKAIKYYNRASDSEYFNIKIVTNTNINIIHSSGLSITIFTTLIHHFKFFVFFGFYYPYSYYYLFVFNFNLIHFPSLFIFFPTFFIYWTFLRHKFFFFHFSFTLNYHFKKEIVVLFLFRRFPLLYFL